MVSYELLWCRMNYYRDHELNHRDDELNHRDDELNNRDDEINYGYVINFIHLQMLKKIFLFYSKFSFNF